MPTLIDTTAAEYRIGPLYIPSRFFALVCFCMMALSNGFAWFEFDPIVSHVKAEFPGLVTSTTIQLLSSWQPIVFIILFVPMTILITKTNGLRKALRIGSSCAVIGAMFKVLGCLFFKDSMVGLAFLNVGQICVAVGAPGVIGGVTSLSAQFFPPHERARATSAAVLFNDLGGAVGYLVSPALVTTGPGLVSLVLFDLALSGTICIMMWFVFPDTPKRRSAAEAAPEDAVALEHHHFEEGSEGIKGAPGTGGILTNLANSDFTSHITFKAQILQLVTRFTPILIMITFNWCSGGFVAWTSMFDLMLEEHYDTTTVGTMSFTASIGYVIGGLVAGYLIDKFFSKHMSAFISVALAIACVATTAFTAVVPNDEGFVAIEIDSPLPIYVFAGLAGVGLGAATPVYFELLADYSYPVDEAVSGGLLSLMEATGALVIYQLIARIFEGSQLNYAFAAGCALCLIASTFFDEQHNRPSESESDGELDGEEGDGIRNVTHSGGGGGRRAAKDGEGGAEELAEVALRKSLGRLGESSGSPTASAVHANPQESASEPSALPKPIDDAKRKQLLLLKKKKLIAAKRAKERERREQEGGDGREERVSLTQPSALEDD